jgi:cob(I)alamin adenosyltransferase
MQNQGLIQVYTGEGKGKTTAALGLICRAKGHGLKVCYIYFHKDPEKYSYGEFNTIKKLRIDTFGFAKKHPYFFEDINIEDIRKECLQGLEFIKKIYKENKYDILILDEILISLRDGFLKEEEILEILDLKPKNLELVLTGRGVTQNIVKRADLVSEIKKIKHPYDAGIQRRKGIEY